MTPRYPDLASINKYEQVIRHGQRNLGLDAPVGRAGAPPSPLVDGEGPFYAMEVQPPYVSNIRGLFEHLMRLIIHS